MFSGFVASPNSPPSWLWLKFCDGVKMVMKKLKSSNKFNSGTFSINSFVLITYTAVGPNAHRKSLRIFFRCESIFGLLPPQVFIGFMYSSNCLSIIYWKSSAQIFGFNAFVPSGQIDSKYGIGTLSWSVRFFLSV